MFHLAENVTKPSLDKHSSPPPHARQTTMLHTSLYSRHTTSLNRCTLAPSPLLTNVIHPSRNQRFIWPLNTVLDEKQHQSNPYKRTQVKGLERTDLSGDTNDWQMISHIVVSRVGRYCSLMSIGVQHTRRCDNAPIDVNVVVLVRRASCRPSSTTHR